MPSKRHPLTERLIAAASCPPGKTELLLWDSLAPGLVVRVRPSGAKSYALRYRPDGGGRAAPIRKLGLGEVGAISLGDARKAATVRRGEVASGADPHAVKVVRQVEARRAERARLSAVLASYEKDLARRQIVKRKEVVSILARELVEPLGDPDLRRLDRATLVERIAAVAASGRPGAASYLRGKVTPFLNWAVDAGLLSASPLAGWRKPRRSRAERLAKAGRALEDWELPGLWRAASAGTWPLAPYLQLLLLTGQRRTETAAMRWADLDLVAGQWTIPAEITKSGRAHRVPLAPEAVAILAGLPRLAGTLLVFPGRGGKAISGWTKRLQPVLAATAAEGMPPWTLHDLRRTVRTGLGRLGILPHVGELLLNHALSDQLAAVYDRGGYGAERVAAAQTWGRHVAALMEADRSRVIRLSA